MSSPVSASNRYSAAVPMPVEKVKPPSSETVDENEKLPDDVISPSPSSASSGAASSRPARYRSPLPAAEAVSSVRGRSKGAMSEV